MHGKAAFAFGLYLRLLKSRDSCGTADFGGYTMARFAQRGSALVLICLFLAACQTLPQVPYDRATAGNIKTINVITPATPDRPRVVLASSIGQSLGLIGALVDAGLQDNRETKFQAVVSARNFKGQEAMTRQL